MKKFMVTAFMIALGAAFLFAPATAQHRDDSIEDSWDRAAREKVEQEQRQDQYRWETQQQQQTQQQSQQQQQTQQQHTHQAQQHRLDRYPQLPPNPSAGDYFHVNSALIDSLDNMYCVSSSYVRTLRNRNDAAKPSMMNTPPAQQPAAAEQAAKDGDGRFGYENERWDRDAKPAAPAPPPIPDRNVEELKALHQELLQLLDKCLNQ